MISSDEPKRLILSGALDYDDSPDLRRCADTLLAEGAAPLRVDVCDLDFLDSSGLSALVHAALVARERGTFVCLIGAHEQLQRLLRMTRMESLFRLEDTETVRPARVESSLDLSPGELHLDLPCNLTALGTAREALNRLLDGRGFTPGQRADIQLALGEAIANALRHGCPQSKTDQGVQVHACCDGDGLLLEVTDPGPGFDPALLPLPDVTLLKEGGMGVFFMRSVMDTVTYHHDGRGNTVTMTKRRALPGD
ncbi:MAG: ATP-binding protein [Armatimonadetes bacterium]|nr:ATP-binding protein [Armatimonadota bacterium]